MLALISWPILLGCLDFFIDRILDRSKKLICPQHTQNLWNILSLAKWRIQFLSCFSTCIALRAQTVDFYLIEVSCRSPKFTLSFSWGTLYELTYPFFINCYGVIFTLQDLVLCPRFTQANWQVFQALDFFSPYLYCIEFLTPSSTSVRQLSWYYHFLLTELA